MTEFSSGAGISACKCNGTGLLTKWACGYLQPYPSLSSLCPIHGGCLSKNGFGTFMTMVRCDCSVGRNADLEPFRCGKCNETACSEWYQDDGVIGRKCFACDFFEPYGKKIQDRAGGSRTDETLMLEKIECLKCNGDGKMGDGGTFYGTPYREINCDACNGHGHLYRKKEISDVDDLPVIPSTTVDVNTNLN